MKTPSVVAAVFAAACLISTPSFAAKAEVAKGKGMAQYDTNKNRQIDPEEYAGIRAAFAAKPTDELKRLDTDSDGTLSDEELAAFSARAGKKPKGDADKAEKQAKRAEKKKPSKTGKV